MSFEASMEPYAQLVRSLLPRATALCLFDHTGKLLWSSVANTNPELFALVLQAITQTEAAGIVKNAERQIELETARALQQIRTEAVDLSVAIASKLLERNLSKADNERLIEETFKQIEERRPS